MGIVKRIAFRPLYVLLAAAAMILSSTVFWAQNWDFDNSGDFATNPDLGMLLSVQSGWTGASAWNTRGDIAMSSAMTPLGDGTFQLRLDLTPGGQYNYLFFATGTTNTASYGFANGSVNAEPVPNSGGDMGTFFSFSSHTVSPVVSSGSPSIGYGAVSGDGRRLIRMPDVTPGTTVWIFNNFASTPNGVTNTNVDVNEGQVKLSWQGGQGHWGAGTGSMDILGGRIRIYVSSNALNGPYGLLADLAGTSTNYTHSNLTQGVSYYFVFVTSDSYGGQTNPTSPQFFANLTRDRLGNPGQSLAANNWKSNAMGFTYNDLTGKPNAKTPAYFKVQKPELDYILTHGSIVYLTPWEVNDPAYPLKIAAKFMVAYIPLGRN